MNKVKAMSTYPVSNPFDPNERERRKQQKRRSPNDKQPKLQYQK
jgi:hypothetical protein